MIARIARKEFTDVVRDNRFRWSVGIVMILLVAALVMGWKHHRDVSLQHERARALTRRQWLEQGVKNPHAAAHYGVYAFKPDSPLSLVDPGVEPYTGVAVWLEAHKQNELLYRPAQDSTAIQRLGEMTGASVLQLLLPLLIVLLTFSIFSGEREAGTLRQLMSLGVPRRDLVVGKALGIAVVLGTLLVPATVVGVAALVLGSSGPTWAWAAPRLALMVMGYLLYFGIFIGVSLAVSAAARTSRLALLILLGFWIVNGLVAPRAASDLAEQMHPTPSAVEFAAAIQDDIRRWGNPHDLSDPRSIAIQKDVMERYGVNRVEDLPISLAGIALQAGEEHGYTIFDRHYANLYEQFRRQERVRRWLSPLSPLLAVCSLSMSLAGTDQEQHQHFATAAEHYRRQIAKVMNDDLTRHGRGLDWDYKAGPELWSRMPDFEYSAPSLRQELGAVVPSFAILAAWSVFAALASAVSMSRLRPI
jgi:ABC-2 type transport system permease protein